jgi:hypothetical protein
VFALKPQPSQKQKTKKLKTKLMPNNRAASAVPLRQGGGFRLP